MRIHPARVDAAALAHELQERPHPLPASAGQCRSQACINNHHRARHGIVADERVFPDAERAAGATIASVG
jgi:hypothetical protein